MFSMKFGIPQTQRVKTVYGVFFVCLALMGCAGSEADFEKAEYLLGKGSAQDGVEAEALVTPHLSGGSIAERMRAHRLLAGAKVAQAGFDGIGLIANLVHKEGEDTIRALGDALGDDIVVTDSSGERIAEPTLTQIAAAARTQLDSGLSTLNNFRADADYIEVDISTSTACAISPKLCREKEAVEYNIGLLYLTQALNIALRQSTFLESEFDVAQCESLLNSGTLPDDFAGALLNARVSFVRANLDDTNATVVAAAGTSVDPALNSLNELIDDIQTANIDTDYDGALDGADKAQRLCEYLRDQDS